MNARILVTLGLLAAALQGCGGSGSAAGDAELTSCASRFNAERAGPVGAHAYAEHGSQEALVTTLDIDGADACAVVFAVQEGDPEYGTVGEVVTLRGWLPLQAAGDSQALQRRGATEANATVAPDGTVTLR